MGGSQTGRHADGPRLYGAQAVWPTEWRARWERVRADAVERFRAPARVGASAGVGRSLRSVLSDAGVSSSLRRLAARHKVDEADVARLWAACEGGDPRTTAARVDGRLRLVRSLEEAVREAARAERLKTPAATRDHLRVLAVSAALALKDEAESDAVRRFLKEALPERIG